MLFERLITHEQKGSVTTAYEVNHMGGRGGENISIFFFLKGLKTPWHLGNSEGPKRINKKA